VAELRSSLAGKRVVVTRAVEQSAGLIEALAARDAIPVSVPLISFSPPDDFASLDSALARLADFDWIIFTSANAVQSVTARLASLGRTLAQDAARPQIAVVGPGTQTEAVRVGFSVAYVANTHNGVALAKELGSRVYEKKIFLPRSDRANPDLPAALRQAGARVTEVIAYRTSKPANVDASQLQRILTEKVDAVLFFSPSAVHHFAELAGPEQLATLQNTVALVAVGPVTASALRELRIERLVVATDATTAAMIEILERKFAATTQMSSAAGVHRE
jgi:uroporphyrinogen-III synthase